LPGLAGLVTRNPDRNAAEQLLARMLRRQLHQPSCRWSSLCLPEQGIYVGWVNNPSMHAQPLTVQNSHFTLVFCGETFLHGAVDGSRPSERHAIVSSLEADPDGFVSTLNGWFAGLLIDHRKRSAVLFNDRYGMHRVYYCRTPDSFLFASEAKSLLAVRPETRSLDPESVGHFLGFGTVFANRTLYANVSLLPAASCWSIEAADVVKMRRYFQPSEWEMQAPLSSEEFQGALTDTVRRVFPAYFAADTPVGLSLTGGLDTRMVMAAIPRDGQPRPCYTYGGVYRECYDVQIARELAATCNLSHSVLPLGSDFFDKFRDYAERTIWLTDGCLDLTGAHELYYSELAYRCSPVRLTGNYGSEILRGVTTFKHHPVSPTLLGPHVALAMEQAKARHTELLTTHPVTFAAFAEVPWHLAGRRMAAESVMVLRSPYMDNELLRLLYRAPVGARETPAASLQVVGDLDARLAKIPTDMGRGGRGGVSPVSALNRLSRYLSFKAEWYYNLGMPDWVVRHERVLQLHALERLFLGRHKIDHYRLWFRDRLRQPILDVLTCHRARSRNYLDPGGLQTLVKDFERDDRNYVTDITRLTTLELIQQLLIERHDD
jgi:asparagine synthase (glutamine-hydrolysing)